MKYLNIFYSLLQKNRRAVILQKIFLRFFDKKNTLSKVNYYTWLNANSISIEQFCNNINKSLWNDLNASLNELKDEANKNIKNINVDLGGGGSIELLYFLTKHTKAEIVVETGVAAGFSSFSILKAMNENDKGFLYSSDFPYFRISNSEKYIGILVPDELKHRWKLYLEGDRKNLKKIVSEIKNIDIFHYDSDKSYLGRKKSLEVVHDYLKNSWIIMDDIQDNNFFYDYVIDSEALFQTIKYKNKWIGVIYPKNKN